MKPQALGAFLSTLRKAGAMSQRELAEKLHVSDKTVSRWECGDGEPDIASILALSEIFGVTCDELLRGRRLEPGEPSKSSTPIPGRLLNKTPIPMIISALGIPAAVVGALLLESAALGFFLSCCFCLTGAVIQWFFSGNALSEFSRQPQAEESPRFREALIRSGAWTAGTILAVLGFSLPLVLLPPMLRGIYGTSVTSLGVSHWLALGISTVAMLLSLLPMAIQLTQRRLFRQASTRHQKAYNRILLLTFALTLALQGIGCHFLWRPEAVAQGLQFQTQEEFVSYMLRSDVDAADAAQIGETRTVLPGGDVFLTYTGRTRRSLADRSGQTVLEFVQRNPHVAGLRYTPGDGAVTNLTVISHTALRNAQAATVTITWSSGLLYPLEVLTALLLFRRKPNA